jgi:hypothetical protein
MALDPLQEQILRIAQALPEAHTLALAGGGAMLAHGFVDRLTRDVDLFTDRDEPEALAVARALRAALIERGLDVQDGPAPREHRFVVRDPVAERVCAVDVFADGGRLQPRVFLDVGPVLHPDDLAADKVLALWSRALPRDFVDVAALTRRYEPLRLLELAAAKDSGFSRQSWVDALAAMRRLSRDDWTRDGVEPAAARQCRDLFTRWRASLLRELAGEVGPGQPGRPGTAPGQDSPRQEPPMLGR